MEEKKHVGRPTNEEVASKKKKKVVKYSLITIVAVLLVGGVTLFLNRDKLDFSSLMGASIFKTYKYVVNDYNNGKGGYYLKMTDSNILKVKSCTVNNHIYASCKVSNDAYGIIVKAKKSGTVTLKVKVINKKNKTTTKRIRVKIPSDYKEPSCEISANNVKRGNIVEAVAWCDEEIYLTNAMISKGYFKTFYNSVVQKGCHHTNYFTDYIWGFEKYDENTYIIKIKIPNNACISNDFNITMSPGAFHDRNGNENIVGFNTSIKITK